MRSIDNSTCTAQQLQAGSDRTEFRIAMLGVAETPIADVVTGYWQQVNSMPNNQPFQYSRVESRNMPESKAVYEGAGPHVPPFRSGEPVLGTVEQSKDSVPEQAVRICSRCVMDTSLPNVVLDEKGICNHCHLHDKLDRLYPLNEEGERTLLRIVEKIKRDGRGKRYDCIVGISGGRDTCYCLYMTKKLGLRPLAVHFDNGWDSEIAKNNLRRVLTALDVDLHTVVADWEESRELTNCTIRASLPYIDMTDDVGIVSALYRTAATEGIRWIIHSHSFRSEGINPLNWNYMDGRLVRHIVKRFARIDLKHFKNVDLHHFFYWIFIKRIKTFTMTNYYNDIGDDIDDLLHREFGWEHTGGWHYDNEIFGLQCYYARHKFGIDLRICEIAAQVRTGVLTRADGLAQLQQIPLIEREQTVQYGLKKQGILPEEWQDIMAAEPKYFTDYPTYYPMLKLLKPLIKLLGRLHVLPGHTYEKFFET